MSRISRSRSVSLSTVLVMALLIGSPVCQRGEAADAAADREVCMNLWKEHLEAVKALEPGRIAVANDAVFFYPDMAALRGRDAIQAHLVKALAGLKILEVGFKIERCEVVGARAYNFATVDELIQEGAASPARRHARYATVWEQQPDKNWQIAYLVVNYLKR